MDGFTLTGLLLGYPTCCIKEFCQGLTNGKPNHNGFIPCSQHSKLSRDEIEDLIGRKLIVPEVLNRFIENPTYENGIKCYSIVGQEEFFKECWKKASLDFY